MKHIDKKMISFALSSLMLVCCTSSFAFAAEQVSEPEAEPATEEQGLLSWSGPLSEFPGEVKITGPLLNAADYSGPMPLGEIEKIKPVYFRDEICGTCTLFYQTAIQGGRPQFLYDTCRVGFNLDKLPPVTFVDSSWVEFTGDQITVWWHIVSGGILHYEINVTFKP